MVLFSANIVYSFGFDVCGILAVIRHNDTINKNPETIHNLMDTFFMSLFKCFVVLRLPYNDIIVKRISLN